MSTPAAAVPRGHFTEMCEALEEVLRGPARAEILERLTGVARDPAAALREAMRSHHFRSSRPVALRGMVEALDAATIRDGFHVLHTWDPVAHRFLPDNTPALLLGYLQAVRGRDPHREQALLLDAYFLFLLVLLATRAWDTEDPNAALDQLDGLLQLLQGDRGSGRPFVRGWPMLIGLAIAQYQPDERGFDPLLGKLRALDAAHERAMALNNAANFGAHLRWGSHFMYEGDVERMRVDNVVDYPWVMHAAATLTRDLAAGDRSPLPIEGLLQVLGADPGVVLIPGEAPSVVAAQGAERAACAATLREHRTVLAEACVAARPVQERYSPLGFHFNFLHNVLTAALAVVVVDGAPQVPLDDLLHSRPAGSRRLADSPDVFAHQLGMYAAHPDRLGAKRAPLIVYDASLGASCLARLEHALAT
ncbi:MAG: hypothetical protein IPK85_12830 [Gemmatimonadetes bacterium]|nr:hypothetical protein [Gemmatimonadota bacterium]